MSDRLERARNAMRDRGVDALLVGASADLEYLVGYHALAMERLTLLVVPADGEATLVVPGLEAPRAEASGATQHARLQTWGEVDDPFDDAAALLADVGDGTLAVQDQLWAAFLLRLQARLPGASWREGGEVMRALRAVKTPEELTRLRAAGQAIDRVHEQVPGLLRAGRTEAGVGRDIAALIEQTHDKVDFIIVASGPNGASPHHETSDRVIEEGDPIVVDIGGTLDGWCSDCTRNYVVGAAPAEYNELYAVLRAAQVAGVEAAAVGTPAEQVDAACRGVIEDAGYGEYFVHRTGHGIGIETHEHPYIVSGNDEPLAAGMTFSVEPGIYLPGRYGARIEDIVAAGVGGGERLNLTTRDLVEVR